jgi:formylmethanofuran dehydrogenase subunit C
VTLVLTLRARPEQRLDLSPLVPHLLARKSGAEIEKIELQTTKVRMTVGDAFRLRMGDADLIRIEGSCNRLDRIGASMSGGAIEVVGDTGIQAGRLMSGGRLTISGSTGPWAASGMTSGEIEIRGSSGERLGGPLAGEVAGMRGGMVVVRGNAGARAGDKMRRGTILIEGHAGDHPGSRMIAGTLIVRRGAGVLPGYLMKRGTIVLGGGASSLSPTFVDCGTHRLLAMRLMEAFIKPYSAPTAVLLGGAMRRYAGDMAVLGKGELFTGTQS